MSALVPIRWGVVEAARALTAPRLAAALGCAVAPLLAFQVDPHGVGTAPLWLMAASALLIALSPPSGAAMPTAQARSWAGWAGGLTRAALATGLAAAVCAGWAWAAPEPLVRETLEHAVLGVASLSLVAAALRQRVSAPPLALALLAPFMLIAVELSGMLLMLCFWAVCWVLEVPSLPPGVEWTVALLPALCFHAVLSFTHLATEPAP